MLRTRLIAGTTAGFVLSAVFATLLTGLALLEATIEPLRVDPDHPAPVTLRLPPTTLRVADDEGGIQLETIAPTIGMGQVVRDRITASIVRMYERTRRPPGAGTVIGLWFIYFLIAGMVTSYLRGFTPGRGALLRTQAGLLGLAGFLLVLAKVFLLFTDLPPFFLPVGALGLWASLFLERRTAFMMAVALAFLSASLVGFRLTAITVYLVAGVTSVAVFRDRKHTASIMLAGLIGGIAAATTLVASKMIFEGGIEIGDDLARLAHSDILASLGGGILGGLLGFFFQGLAVLALGAVSRQRLLDLTDLDQPLLQKMAREAPGSWEHSRAMANLAEGAAAAIGADSLLTRVGAYFHDLGKTVQAKYFVENLDPGERSPHEDLEPDVSADAIMAHVVEGTRILRRGGIPEPVVEFAYTHHGTSVIEYFWHKCLEQGNPKSRKESFFRYPGMRPRTKETAILMLIDSIEAASRTIDPPTRDKFEEMVQRIIFVKLKQGQLDECGLTTVDLRVLATKLTDTLVNVYHKRIKYPWQERREGQEELPIPGLATEKDIARERSESEATEAALRKAAARAAKAQAALAQAALAQAAAQAALAPAAGPEDDYPEVTVEEGSPEEPPSAGEDEVEASAADVDRATVPDTPAGPASPAPLDEQDEPRRRDDEVPAQDTAPEDR